MSLCPESERRRSMPDAEFWAEVAEHILGAPGGGDDEPEIDPEVQRDPCPECGETGACAWTPRDAR